VVAHAQTSVVPAVEASGKLLLQDLLCFALETILCVADVSRGAGGVVVEGARAGAGEGARGLTRGGVRARGGGRGRGRGRGSGAPAARAPPPNRTRTREVRPAQRLDNQIAWGRGRMPRLVNFDPGGQQSSEINWSGVFALGRARNFEKHFPRQGTEKHFPQHL
jgi:hypothetical protein